MRNKGVLLTIWMALSVLGIVLGFVVLSPTRYYELAVRGVALEATIIRLEPDNHRFVHYKYIVDKKEYYGVGNAGRGNAAFDDLGVGQAVLSYYSPANPSVSVLGNPRSHFQTALAGLLFLALVLPSAALYGLRRKGYLSESSMNAFFDRYL